MSDSDNSTLPLNVPGVIAIVQAVNSTIGYVAS